MPIRLALDHVVSCRTQMRPVVFVPVPAGCMRGTTISAVRVTWRRNRDIPARQGGPRTPRITMSTRGRGIRKNSPALDPELGETHALDQEQAQVNRIGMNTLSRRFWNS